MDLVKSTVGLREKKAARIRLDLMNAMVDRLSKQDYSAIRVEDLCEVAMISKVTFFKYFPTKDDLLDLYFSYMVAYQNLSIRKDKLQGLAALRRIFENMKLKFDLEPALMRRLLVYMAERGGRKISRCLNMVELGILFPEEGAFEEVDTMSMGRIFVEQSRLALETGELNPVLDLEQFVMLLSAVFHGTGPSAFRVTTDDAGQYYLKNFDNLIKIINS